MLEELLEVGLGLRVQLVGDVPQVGRAEVHAPLEVMGHILRVVLGD